jgi:outer membrane protein OmpA-like peptidoglycan-associated protein
MGYDKYGLNWDVTARSGASSKKAGSSCHDGAAQNRSAEKDQTQARQEEPPAESPKKKEDPEVELFTADKWEPGPDGFQFNKKCFLTVTGKFLKKTIRKRLLANLFVRFENEDEDLRKEVATYLEDDGTAKFEVPLYIGRRYYDATNARLDAKCHYVLKNIRHSLGSGKLESVVLEMPVRMQVHFTSLPGSLFNTGSAIPSLESDEKLVTILAGALKFAQESSNKEIVCFGHADKGGTNDSNYELSKRRALAIKSLLAGESSAFVNIAVPHATIRDQQSFLYFLSNRHGWNCAPGAFDGIDGPKTRRGRESFQQEYNQKFSGDLVVDGVFGRQTWSAVFTVIRSLISSAYQSLSSQTTFPVPAWGFRGTGVYPCGESFALQGRSGMEVENRRVDIVFFAAGDSMALQEHRNGSEPVTKNECPIYDDTICQRVEIDIAVPELDSGYVGVVLVSSDLRPIAGCGVTLLVKKTSTQLETTSDAKGRIEFTSIPIGDHRLRLGNGSGEYTIATHKRSIGNRYFMITDHVG